MVSQNPFIIVPSDSANLPGATTGGIWIGTTGSGNLTITTLTGQKIAFAGLVGGTLFPIVAAKIWATGTDVTNLVGLK